MVNASPDSLADFSVAPTGRWCRRPIRRTARRWLCRHRPRRGRLHAVRRPGGHRHRVGAPRRQGPGARGAVRRPGRGALSGLLAARDHAQGPRLRRHHDQRGRRAPEPGHGPPRGPQRHAGSGAVRVGRRSEGLPACDRRSGGGDLRLVPPVAAPLGGGGHRARPGSSSTRAPGSARPDWEWEDRYRYQKQVYESLDALRAFGLPIYLPLPWKQTAQHDELLEICIRSGFDYGRCHRPDQVLDAMKRIGSSRYA